MSRSKQDSTTPGLLKLIGPGILVAATGVGAGDLATGALAGSKLGVAVLWAVLVGAFLKFVLSEGLARWQLATGRTLLEGCVIHFGWPAQALFLIYLLVWSIAVGSALMSACGVTAYAILENLFGMNGTLGLEPRAGKIVLGILQSLVAVILVRRGGYRLFEKVMSVCIAAMFVTVVATAAILKPEGSKVASGLLWPSIPDLEGAGLGWTIALLGGVGGTLTILCYGYWIREEGRRDAGEISLCRIDLATGYAMTALFGVGMVIIGSRIAVEGSGATLIVQLADTLTREAGRFGWLISWAFLLGAWGAVFSSLLGVWQCVPYLFADFWNTSRQKSDLETKKSVDTAAATYRGYLYALASLPACGLWFDFQQVQKLYAMIGAAFIPMLSLSLLILNGRKEWIGERFTNRKPTVLILAITIGLFLLAGWFEIQRKLAG